MTLVLAGLVGMHGLTTSHAAPSMSEHVAGTPAMHGAGDRPMAPTIVAGPSPSAPVAASSAGGDHVDPRALTQAVAAVVASGLPAAGHQMMAGACLAIIAAAITLLLARAAGAGGRHDRTQRRAARTWLQPTGSGGPSRTFCLSLEQLSLLRT